MTPTTPSWVGPVRRHGRPVAPVHVTQLADLLDRDVEVGSAGDLLLGLTADLTAYAGGLRVERRLGRRHPAGCAGRLRAPRDGIPRRGIPRAGEGDGPSRPSRCAPPRARAPVCRRRHHRQPALGRAVPLVQHADPDARARLGRASAPMLEGQVAVLGCGLLDGRVRGAARGAAGSELYRADQGSYQLYPDKDLPGFLDRNTVAPAAAAAAPLLDRLADAGDRSLVVRDSAGAHHFSPPCAMPATCGGPLRSWPDPRFQCPRGAGSRVGAGPVRADLPARRVHRPLGHLLRVRGASAASTGTWWLLLPRHAGAFARCSLGGEPSAVVEALEAAYREIQAGLGYRRTPAEYGAFPTDPYSHTPAGQGGTPARDDRPGEGGEVITRWGELGVEVSSGRVAFDPQWSRRVSGAP